MGVPALFRWLSKKYPKIVQPVIEDETPKVPDMDGVEVDVPVDISMPNPNGLEFDNLYLDMNGIVHPCTHPEGKPPPETEDEMMIEVFKYTDRIVNMVRPRKLLFMAIDGVAPRAKMNQQRSRRFRSAQEAKEKEEARAEGLAFMESLGHQVSEETKSKKSWDSNAITPGTPFMDLLASSLRYWVVQKVNQDPGWKNLQVVISDAGVPGEGEHKIMDFIRRQRVNPDHNPNEHHVIYGLDADLIMLALATHEPHFRVLREDVFAQETSSSACRICGQEGHYAAQCTADTKKVEIDPQKKTDQIEKKPFVFLDVGVLREYLEIELNITHAPFPFNLEQAIDDWVLLIFFVGNDFLPHLPSLEIREGAIDTLLKIWKDELPRMGGYLTNHGKIELAKAQIILDGLAKRENEIFQRRREAEQRQDQNAKRRKIEQESGGSISMKLSDATYVAITPSVLPQMVSPTSIHPSLPQRPSFDIVMSEAAVAAAVDIPSSTPSASSNSHFIEGSKAMSGSNHDVVANRRAIRMANMSAAEMLRAEMTTLSPVKAGPRPTSTSSSFSSLSVTSSFLPDSEDSDIPGLSMSSKMFSSPLELTELRSATQNVIPPPSVEPAELSTGLSQEREPAVELIDVSMVPGPPPADLSMVTSVKDESSASPRGVKRKLDEQEHDSDEDAIGEDDEEVIAARKFSRKVNPDGTIDQEDTVRLWEPGYRERYYREKFGVGVEDSEFQKKITKSYVEGLSWVLQYYYQGTPSWTWFYPYHYAPFAADFQDVEKMDIRFEIGKPFRPFEQLMGVFPAASRQHIPEAFQGLMVDENSPIIDFYPTGFEIDMNGKKMAWQGVALLPFIDETRLLEALKPQYPKLTEEEVKRNQWGNNIMYVAEDHRLYDFMCGLYTKRKSTEPVPIDTKFSKGIAGQLLADPQCVPGSTYLSPLASQGLSDIVDDRSISAIFFFPKQRTPHRSMLLPGVRRGPRVLTPADQEFVRRGGRGRGREGGPGSWTGRDNARHSMPYNGSSYGQGGVYGAPQSYGSSSYGGRGDSGYGSRDSGRSTPGSYSGGRSNGNSRGTSYGGTSSSNTSYLRGGRGGTAINGAVQYQGSAGYAGYGGGMQGSHSTYPQGNLGPSSNAGYGGWHGGGGYNGYNVNGRGGGRGRGR